MKKLLFIPFSVVLLLLIVGCKGQKLVYVPVEKETVKTEYVDKIERDSIYLQDSIFIHHKGDTVYKEKYRYFYKDKLIHDSIYINDSILVNIPYPVEVVKETNKLHNWQIILMILGGVLIGYLGVRIVRFLN